MSSSSANREAVERLFDEFVERRRRGEQPSLSEYVERYPDLAEDIRAQFPAFFDDSDKARDLELTEASGDAPPSAPARRVEQLGDFRILREIGRGGMGIVYEAEQESLGRHVALKVLLANSLLDPKQVSRFQREARSAARLHHTNIVPVFGVGEHQGTHYYVMQYIPGRGLDNVLTELKWLRKHGRVANSTTGPTGRTFAAAKPEDVTAADPAQQSKPGQDLTGALDGSDPLAVSDVALSSSSLVAPPQTLDLTSSQSSRHYWQSVARIGSQVAAALAYAHSEGILHRDIKPANLLLDNKGTVWVTDFGLAKATEQDNLTHTGDIIGTLRYMAPEAFRGKSDPRSDIYALGLTLYELIALRPAFDASDRNTLIRQVSGAEVAPLRKFNPGVPNDLETIVLKTLDRDPAHRYQSAGDLADDLERFIKDEPIEARRATLPERFGRWCRHNPVVAALLLTLVIVFLSGFGLVTWKWRDAEHQKAALARAKDQISFERNSAIVARDEATAAKLRAETSAAEAKKAASISEAINTFLVDDILAAAAPERARGRKITVEDVLKEVVPKIEGTLGDQPEVEASVRNTLGITFQRLGLPAEAEPQLRQALELRLKALGPDAPDTLAAMNNLARVLQTQGKLSEAEPLYRQSWEIRSRTLGPDNPQTLGAFNNLAQLVQAQGKLIEAEPMLKQSWEAYRRVLGPGDPDTLLALGNYAMVLQAQGKASEAEPLMRETLAGLSKALKDDHPYVLTAMHNLARLLADQGRLDEAEKYYRQALAGRRRVLGDEHPDTLVTMNQLATLLQDQGNLSEAEKIARQMYEANARVSGEEHPNTISARHNLSRLLQAQGKAAEAEPLVRQNVEIARRVLGPDHPDTLQAMSSLAIALQAEDKLAEAEPLVREVLAAQRRVLGPEHPHTLVSANNLAVLLQAEGKLDEAEPLVRENLAICRRVLGPEHPDTLLAMSNLAAMLVARGKWSEAEPLVRDSLAVRTRVLGPDHPDTLNAMDDLVLMLGHQHKLAEAAPLLLKLIDARARVFGNDHPDTLKAMNSLASIYQAQGEFAQAEPLLAKIYAASQRLSGDRDPATLAAEQNWAEALLELGKAAAAEPLFTTLLAARQATLPADDPEIAEAQVWLGRAMLAEGRADEARKPLEAAVAADHKNLPEGDWRTAQAESVLGECRTKLGQYDEAESLLLPSFGILEISRDAPDNTTHQAIERIIRLYEAWKKPALAAEWRERLPMLKPAPVKP
jgi:serine/threonine protein kinase/Tfp pilus assembly protein PilF